MRLLLDTHVALWVVQSPDELSDDARAAIVAAEEIVLSVVSPWELVIKASLGRIALHRPVADLVSELEREFGAIVLQVRMPHVLSLASLPPHHGDPFDRLLIAQAHKEDLTIVTRDAAFQAYGVPLVHT